MPQCEFLNFFKIVKIAENSKLFFVGSWSGICAFKSNLSEFVWTFESQFGGSGGGHRWTGQVTFASDQSIPDAFASQKGQIDVAIQEFGRHWGRYWSYQRRSPWQCDLGKRQTFGSGFEVGSDESGWSDNTWHWVQFEGTFISDF